METDRATLVERAQEAAGLGEWHRAYDMLVEADAQGSLEGPALFLLADVAYAAGHLDVTIATWERAHSEALAAGDRRSAAGAAVRVAMHLLFDTGFMAPVRGWIRRTARLLDGEAGTPVHAWLAVVHSYERMLSGDFEAAVEHARNAVEVGAVSEPAAAAVGRVAEARSLIFGGEISRGLALLDEAAVAAVSGELDPLFTGVVYCEVVCAFQALAQYDLAEEWTAAMETWRHGQPVGSIHGRCRVHRAEILRLRGDSVGAEQQAALACEELRPYVGRELGWPLTELGHIRLRRGDLGGAEEMFRAAHEVGWDPYPGLALVQLARGEPALAARSIQDALEHPMSVPSKELPPNTELRRVPLLEAQVTIELAADHLDRARAAATELAQIAGAFESRALTAGAAYASASVLLAEGAAADARQHFERAVEIWSAIGAPYETARARMGLGRAHRLAGREERAVLELRAARAGFERVGARRETLEAARACGEADGDEGAPEQWRGASPKSPDRARGKNSFRLEGDYWSVTFEGRTTRVRDLKGLGYIARLLQAPGREVHAVELAGYGHGARAGGAPDPYADRDAGPFLDARAKEAYRRRLVEIEEDMEEAQVLGDDERAAQAELEREVLKRELARAVGLGGRDRRVGSRSERARASVTRAIRRAIDRIREHDRELAEHFDHAIRTGTHCTYRPDPRAIGGWES